MDPQYQRYYTYIRPVIKNSYVRAYSPLVFSLIAIIFFGFFAIRPTFKTILSLQRSINEQQQVLTQVKAKSASLEQAKANYQAIDQQTKDEIDNLLPNDVRVAELIDHLNDIAATHQATVSALQFQPIEINEASKSAVTAQDISEMAFIVNFQGDYNQLVGILDSLSQFSRLLSVDTVSFSRSDNTTISMSIHGKAYFLK